MKRTNRRRAGFSLLEVMFAASFLALAILGAFQLGTLALWQQQQTRERSIARLAMLKTRESMAGVRFRRLSTGDNATGWLGRGGFEIARNAGSSPPGASLQMPDLLGTAFTTGPDQNNPSPALPANGAGQSGTNVFVTGASNGIAPTLPGGWTSPTPFAYGAKVDGVERCLCVEFPVQPLVEPKGVNRKLPGRIVLYLDESKTSGICNTAAFPFPATPGLTGLDCNGDGAITLLDLRAKLIATAKTSDAGGGPTMMIPIKIRIDWQSRGRVESLTSWHLLCYRGYD